MKAFWLKNNSQKQEVNFTSYKTKHGALVIRMFVFFLCTVSPPLALSLPFINKCVQLLAGPKQTSKGRNISVWAEKTDMITVYEDSCWTAGGSVGVILILSSVWAFHLLGTHCCIFGLKSLLGEHRTLAENPLITYLLKSFIVPLAKGWGADVYQFYALAYWRQNYCPQSERIAPTGIRARPEGTE